MLTVSLKEVNIKDFYDDQVMLRQIKRAQAEKERRDEDDENDVDADGDSSMMQARNVKSEGGRDRGNQLLADLGLTQADGDEDEDEV
jgi:E3 SUMO-protein ligase NSE2